jgi:putative Ca2+/H+ antiporter (TMEM165/GDT1 family)
LRSNPGLELANAFGVLMLCRNQAHILANALALLMLEVQTARLPSRKTSRTSMLFLILTLVQICELDRVE